MNKVIYVLAIAIALVSCKEESKDYVTLSGTILNQNSDSLMVLARGFKKRIEVKENGTFSDTLKIVDGNFVIYDGSKSASVYLKNGFDLNVSLDTENFNETIKYEGFGAEANNYLAARSLLMENVFKNDEMYQLEKPKFDDNLVEISSKFHNLLSETKNLDTVFIASEKSQIKRFTDYVSGSYTQKQYMLTVLSKGGKSPKFVDYENYKGGTTSLDDLKGKYVYVDVWATWCGPCKREIPFLKEVEKAYHDKNIEFVSISIDKKNAHDAWKKMVADKELGGVQLFADNDWSSKFVTDYKINGIPRFILIDSSGNIVSADAPRPSSEDLKVLLNELL